MANINEIISTAKTVKPGDQFDPLDLSQTVSKLRTARDTKKNYIL